MREVEVAVGFTDHTWRELWVEVPEDDNHVLDDEEASEKAEEVALEIAAQADWDVAFTSVLYLKPPEDDLNGIV